MFSEKADLTSACDWPSQMTGKSTIPDSNSVLRYLTLVVGSKIAFGFERVGPVWKGLFEKSSCWQHFVFSALMIPHHILPFQIAPMLSWPCNLVCELALLQSLVFLPILLASLTLPANNGRPSPLHAFTDQFPCFTFGWSFHWVTVERCLSGDGPSWRFFQMADMTEHKAVCSIIKANLLLKKKDPLIKTSDECMFVSDVWPVSIIGSLSSQGHKVSFNLTTHASKAAPNSKVLSVYQEQPAFR